MGRRTPHLPSGKHPDDPTRAMPAFTSFHSNPATASAPEGERDRSAPDAPRTASSMVPGSEPARAPAQPLHASASRPAAGPHRSRWIWIKVLVWVLCLFPFAHLLYDAITDNLQAEPVKEITHRTGWWALFLLMTTLGVTPLRHLTGWKQVVRIRRTLGLFGFFYATLHVLIYFGLDQFFAFDIILEDVTERPFITVGFAAWILLIPLAVTSTRGWVRRLGKRWQTLHRLAYAATGLAVLHFYWAMKADTREPLLFAAALAALLLLRLPAIRRRMDRHRRR